MRLKYEFEILPMEDKFVAVPVGENSQELQATLELNSVAAQMLRRVAQVETPEAAHKLICADYPQEDPDQVGQELCNFLNLLVREGILQP